MATITIRNLDETVKRKLQVRAALNGRSMEAELREMISQLAMEESDRPRLGLGTAIHKRFAALGGVEIPNLDEGLGTAIHKLFAPLGGVELQIPPRQKSHRQIPTFEE